MGWIEPHRFFHSIAEVHEYIRKDLDHERCEIVADSMQLGTWYGAIRMKDTGKTFCAVTLWKPRGSLRNGARVLFKEMDEGCGPHERKPTLKVLRALTPLPPPPTDGSPDHLRYTREWRAAAFARFKNKKGA